MSVRAHRRPPEGRRERAGRVDDPLRHHRPAHGHHARPDSLVDKVALGTWLCGDPGVQFEDTIQRWHTCPNTAPINSSEPVLASSCSSTIQLVQPLLAST